MSVTPALVDDALLIRLLIGDLPESVTTAPLCTTTGYWFRMARAVTAPGTRGRLSGIGGRLAPWEHSLLVRQIDRLDDLVSIADVRGLVPSMARLAATYGLNLLAAEVVAAAMVFTARVVVAEGNLGPRLAATVDALGIEVTELHE